MQRQERARRLSSTALFLPALWLMATAVHPQTEASPGPTASPLQTAELRQEVRRMIAAARDRVFPSLVHIEAITVRYEGGREVRGRREGSGTLITSEGHVLTNQHVVQRGTRFRCTLADRQKVSARLIGEDPLTDLAVLQIDRSELADGGRGLRAAQFAASEGLEIGDYVMAMGSPYSLSRSVTLGIVSNPARVLPAELFNAGEMELEPGQRTGLFTLWIQHDALINPGNSGGPLVDLDGNIVGINEMGGAAIGFAIPSGLARRVASELIRHGEVPRSWIGLSFRPIAETGLSRGVLVDSVVAGSPAARAGISTGDAIVSLNGQPVTIRFPEEVPPLMSRIAEEPIGTPLNLTYQRGDTMYETQVVTAKLLRDQGEERSFPVWGFTAQQITPKLAQDLGITESAGSLVSGVRIDGSAHAAQPSLQPGDLIQAITGSAIRDLEDLVAQYLKLQKEKPQAPVLLAFNRRGRSYVTVLKTRASDQAPAGREVPKPWIGVVAQPIAGELGEMLSSPGTRGYRIARVYPGTAASLADLHVGDVIVALEGELLVPRGLEDANILDRRIADFDIGQTIAVTIERDGQIQDKKVILERNLLAPSEARRVDDDDLGLTVREVTFFDRDENRWGDDVQGVIVDKVEPVGTADLAGIHRGELVQKIGQREVRDLKSFEEAIAALTIERSMRVEMIVLDGMRTRLRYLEPDWGALTESPTE